MRFLPANAQHIGARHSQQDSFGFTDPANREFIDHGGFVGVVCDGMGGMEFGDAASRTATRAFLDAYQSKAPEESIPAALQRSVRTANDQVVALAHKYGLSEGMGTTLVAAAVQDHSLYFVSVGDSGLFISSGGSLKMINRPHVFANMLDAAVERGALSREDADNHPERDSLTSFIGAESLEEIDANQEPLTLGEGDVILLASDGLFKTLSTEEMVACLEGDSRNWPDALVGHTLAKRREHQDNVTVLSIASQSGSTKSDGIRTSNSASAADTGVASASGAPATSIEAPELARAPEPPRPDYPAAARGAEIPAAAFAQAVAQPIGQPANHSTNQPPQASYARTVTLVPPPPVAASHAPDASAAALPPQTAIAPSQSRRPILLLIVVLALVLAAGAAWWFFARHRTSQLTTNPVTDPGNAVSPGAVSPGPIKPVDPNAPAPTPASATPQNPQFADPPAAAPLPPGGAPIRSEPNPDSTKPPRSTRPDKGNPQQ